MHIVNHTDIPDKSLRKVLMAAAQRMGIRTGFFIRVTRAIIPGQLGAETKMWNPTAGEIGYKPPEGTSTFKWFISDGGWYTLSIGPAEGHEGASIQLAECIYDYALHESAHIKQNQNRERFQRPEDTLDRQKAWKTRPVEIDAENKVYDVSRRPMSKKAVEGISELSRFFNHERRGRIAAKPPK